MELLLVLIALLALVLLTAAAVRLVVDVAVIHDYERGLRFRGGRLVGLVGPGTVVGVRPFIDVRVLDVRPTIVAVDGQEVLTADGVAAKISLVARYTVGDIAAAITLDADYRRSLYLQLQLALRDALARRTLDEALAARREIGPEVREACAGPMAAIGIDLGEVSVRDVMLPGELKRAYASVIAARKDGEAALERARAETAALRGLANAGRQIEENPGLLQLRLLQELGQSSGNSIVFGAPDGVAAVARPAPARGGRSVRGAGPAASGGGEGADAR